MSSFHERALRYPLLAAVLVTAGCSHNKPVAKVTPPPAPAPTPTATIHVSPENVQAGQSATVTWSTANASNVQIDGIGVVGATGSKQVSPAQSTNYHLTARGEGGNVDATARLTVTPAPVASTATPTEEELFRQQVKDLYFAYDKYDLNSADQSTISADATFFKQHSNLRFVIEGHCDERGSEEYNMALGDNRAETTKKQLIALGVDASRIKIVSYGKEKPFCSDDNEGCFQQNRRAHFTLDR